MEQMTNILLIEADETVRQTLSDVLRQEPTNYVTTAATSAEAQNLIKQNKFDRILIDQRQPVPDLTVSQAARAANPAVQVAFLYTYPQLDTTTQNAMKQVHQFVVNPNAINRLIPDVKAMAASPNQVTQPIQSVASILERTEPVAIEQWYSYVSQDEALANVKLTKEQRCSHLPQLFRELIARLINNRPVGSNSPVSPAAVEYGVARFQQKYTAPMLAQEARLFQNAVTNTLKNNQANIDYPILLTSIGMIQDEIGNQLWQASESFARQGVRDQVPA